MVDVCTVWSAETEWNTESLGVSERDLGTDLLGALQHAKKKQRL